MYFEMSGLALGRPANLSYLQWKRTAPSVLLDVYVPQARPQIPYKEFQCEYPPLAMVVFILPRIVCNSPPKYIWAFGLLMGATAIAGLFPLYRIRARAVEEQGKASAGVDTAAWQIAALWSG